MQGCHFGILVTDPPSRTAAEPDIPVFFPAFYRINCDMVYRIKDIGSFRSGSRSALPPMARTIIRSTNGRNKKNKPEFF